MIHLSTGRCIGAAQDGRPRQDLAPRVAALGISICMSSTPALAQTHTGAASAPTSQPLEDTRHDPAHHRRRPSEGRGAAQRAQRRRDPSLPRDVSDADVADLRRRLAATRWPDKETVADHRKARSWRQLQELVRYWGTDYDWRKGEAKLNAFPQFKTKIDGVDIHFIHVRSRHPNAMPLIITHGWPGSVFEQIKLIGPLTDPTEYGGRAEDAFDVVIPSLPGFGFSDAADRGRLGTRSASAARGTS